MSPTRTSGSGLDLHERLHQEAQRIKQSRERLCGTSNREAKELRQKCTFKPDIDSSIVSHQLLQSQDPSAFKMNSASDSPVRERQRRTPQQFYFDQIKS